MNRKQKIMALAGGDPYAAWLLDTLLWAEEKFGDGERAPWTLAKASEVAGMSYDQGKRAARKLREAGAVSDSGKGWRGGIRVIVDLDQWGGGRPFKGAGGSPLKERGAPLSPYVCMEVNDMQRRAQDGTSVNELLFGKEVKDDPPRRKVFDKGEPPPKKEMKKKGPPEQPPRGKSVDDLVKRKATVANVAALWSALNVTAGRDHSLGRSWSEGKLQQALREMPEALPRIRLIYESWPAWSDYVREQTGMKAPEIPFLWHIGINRGLIDGFLDSGMAKEVDEGYDLDEWARQKFGDG